MRKPACMKLPSSGHIVHYIARAWNMYSSFLFERFSCDITAVLKLNLPTVRAVSSSVIMLIVRGHDECSLCLP